jgi:hypothetical protein
MRKARALRVAAAAATLATVGGVGADAGSSPKLTVDPLSRRVVRADTPRLRAPGYRALETMNRGRRFGGKIRRVGVLVRYAGPRKAGNRLFALGGRMRSPTAKMAVERPLPKAQPKPPLRRQLLR